MRVSDFDFELPEDRIALRPARPRDAARLLHVGADGALGDFGILDLPGLLQPGDLMVFNDTRVIPAALNGIRPARAEGAGGDVAVEVNLHKRESADTWHAFARPAKRLRDGDKIAFGALSCTVISKADGGDVALRFDRSGADLDAAIAEAGAPPLPPYIARKRTPDAQDTEDYQTTFARAEGSVAAPTAGLHFTDRLFAALDARGVERTHVTLHVGAGTFLPVKAENTVDHVMHAEWYEIGVEAARTINTAKAEGRRVIPVGTTALRTIESAARDGAVKAEARDTSIFITPGYDFRVTDALLTNFHLPKSTLFMLVSALSTLPHMQAAYAHAIANGYRFYSYGDACLIERAHD
ncbi:tRNA preQ1(34) S-adenosylmethionine ribosyltransferase-isomerase QueA [Hyphobacterium marinum]|uniref:S-adenosylmethionine:tRNA ribosyltransferase-isomerase n=1 Tax=Hyphobacterium marinum TaxID=3116574 RepID=A0ABU7M2M5_9PROT|nr:tRNA preQ1(34) S-adenosylmethionine ribosyltransferase-isomerase QueA [Hyphobacterium sp. Y6023]MEE2567655.1 tRNA preQ1(34) S-adenosylmethionine ribosyltransferase-isomerase QueA [Hyphobacterium sp. Y6023]